MQSNYLIMLHDTSNNNYELVKWDACVGSKEENDHITLFQWQENNWSCDCNRSLEMYDDREYKCSGQTNVIQLLWIVDEFGKFLYKRGENE